MIPAGTRSPGRSSGRQAINRSLPSSYFDLKNPRRWSVIVAGAEGGWPRPLGLEGIEAIMFRTIGDRPSLWESLLPAEVLRLPEELARVDALLDDPAFFAPFAPHFHPVLGRPSTPVECYLRLMFLKFRYRLGYESLCAEVSDSISWRRFCRIPLDGKVPHPTTLMKLTSRCGEDAVAGLNEALRAKAAGAKLLRTARVRADTTVIRANVAYPTDRGCWPRRSASWCATARRVQAAGGATGTVMTDRRRAAARRVREIAGKLRSRGKLAPGGEHPGDPPGDRRTGRSGRRRPQRRPPRCCATAAAPCPGRSAGGCAAGCGGRWTSWPSPSSAPPRSWRRPGRGWPGRSPDGATRLVSLHDPEARPIRKGRIDRPVEFGYKAQVTDNDDGIILDYAVEYGAAPDGPQLAPAIERIAAAPAACPRAVTADRGYGQPTFERDLHELGVRTVAIPRQAQDLTPPARRSSTAAASTAGQMAHRLRRTDQLPQARLRLGPHPPGRQETEPRSGAGTGSSPTT